MELWERLKGQQTKRQIKLGTSSSILKNQKETLEARLKELFDEKAYSTALDKDQRMGRRIHGVDLKKPLNPEQAILMIDLLDHYSIISFPEQGHPTFELGFLERLANHFGAPLPHPKNYANYVEFKKSGEELKLLPKDKQTRSLCDKAFPGNIKCIDGAESPAVYVVTNLPGSGKNEEEQLASGLHWHTDIEFEPVPLSTSMFYVQCVPISREHQNGTWVPDVRPADGFYHPDSNKDLNSRRFDLPLNGETAYADTASAFEDLPKDKQKELEKIQVRRRLRVSDAGWLTPLVYRNPRTGRQSLHSPVWASRGKNVAPVQIDGFSETQTREYLDELEAHVLQQKYRYDHLHQPGDVTIWSNFATLHNAPPVKSKICSPEDARLMYRISCKGEPSYHLPRKDTDEWLAANISPPYQSNI